VDGDELRALDALDLVVGPPEEIEPRVWRVVVRDADAAQREVPAALERAGVPVVDVQEHIVDFDEAFVRVIERARRRRSQATEDSATVGAP
jgi:hypothetical protein